MGDFEDRRARGLDMYREVNGMDAPAPSSPFMDATLDFAFGEVWTRPALTRKERRLVALTAVAASGAETAMRMHVGTALRSGDLSPEEMREVVLQVAAYQGWPKAATMHVIVEEAVAALGDN